MNTKPILGVSACLLGQPVQFDGGHKIARYMTQMLSEYFELMPASPEVEAGQVYCEWSRYAFASS